MLSNIFETSERPGSEVNAALDFALNTLRAYVNPNTPEDEFIKAETQLTLDDPFNRFSDLYKPGQIDLAERALFKYAHQTQFLSTETLTEYTDLYDAWSRGGRERKGNFKEAHRAYQKVYQEINEKMNARLVGVDQRYKELAQLGLASFSIERRAS